MHHTAPKSTHLLYLLSVDSQSHQPALRPIPKNIFISIVPATPPLQLYDYISWIHVAMQGPIHSHFPRILCPQHNNPSSAGRPLLHPTPPTTLPPPPPPLPLPLVSSDILSVEHGPLWGTTCTFPSHDFSLLYTTIHQIQIKQVYLIRAVKPRFVITHRKLYT